MKREGASDNATIFKYDVEFKNVLTMLECLLLRMAHSS